MIKLLVALALTALAVTGGAVAGGAVAGGVVAQVRPAPPSIAALFGARVSAEPGVKAPFVVGFLTGGRAPDKVYAVHLAPRVAGRSIGKDVTVVSAWATGGARLAVPVGAHLAFAVVNGDTGRKFIVVGADRFDALATPIWTTHPLPAELVKKGSKLFANYAGQEKRIRHDVLALGTEAGIDTPIYWDGTTYRLFTPEEDP